MSLKTFVMTLAGIAVAGLAAAQWQTPVPVKKPALKATPANRAAAKPSPSPSSSSAPPVAIDMDSESDSKPSSSASSSSDSGLGVALSSSMRELERLERVVGVSSPQYIKEYANFRNALDAEKKRLGANFPKFDMPKMPSDDGMRRFTEQKRQESIARQKEEENQKLQEQMNEEMEKRRQEMLRQGYGNPSSGQAPILNPGPPLRNPNATEEKK